MKRKPRRPCASQKRPRALQNFFGGGEKKSRKEVKDCPTSAGGKKTGRHGIALHQCESPPLKTKGGSADSQTVSHNVDPISKGKRGGRGGKSRKAFNRCKSRKN